MPWELADEEDNRYRLPASISPAQNHIGGNPDQRIVRGYGSSDWYTVLDGIRQPQPLELTGTLATDHDYAGMQDLLDELQAALDSAVQLIEVDDAGDIAVMDLLGSLPITTSPEGIDGTLLSVRVPLLPADEDWRPP